jgi:sugar phosphate isomerase/epimerase
MAKFTERLALHTWSLDTTPLGDTLRAAREGGWNAVELRRVDFTRCFDKGMSNDEVLALVRASGLEVACMGTENGPIFAKGDESRRVFGVLEETARNAKALGCKMIMITPGQESGTLREAAANFRAAGDIVAAQGLRIALEFNSGHDVIRGLAAGREVVAGASHPACGLLLDTYHLERCGEGGRGFEDVAPEEIFAFQFSDVPEQPPKDKRPTDRLMPGLGRVRWKEVFGLLAEKGYEGYLSYEGPNPEYWSRPPIEVAREAAAATRKMLAQI